MLLSSTGRAYDEGQPDWRPIVDLLAAMLRSMRVRRPCPYSPSFKKGMPWVYASQLGRQRGTVSRSAAGRSQ